MEQWPTLFARLDDDIGGSKIVSIKATGEKLEMVVENTSGMFGTFILRFDKTRPFLIDGLGIEVGN